MNSVSSNNMSLKYLRFNPSDLKYIGTSLRGRFTPIFKDNIYRYAGRYKFRGLEKMCKQHHLCRTHGILSSGLLLIYNIKTVEDFTFIVCVMAYVYLHICNCHDNIHSTAFSNFCILLLKVD